MNWNLKNGIDQVLVTVLMLLQKYEFIDVAYKDQYPVGIIMNRNL